MEIRVINKITTLKFDFYFVWKPILHYPEEWKKYNIVTETRFQEGNGAAV